MNREDERNPVPHVDSLSVRLTLQDRTALAPSPAARLTIRTGDPSIGSGGRLEIGITNGPGIIIQVDRETQNLCVGVVGGGPEYNTQWMDWDEKKGDWMERS